MILGDIDKGQPIWYCDQFVKEGIFQAPRDFTSFHRFSSGLLWTRMRKEADIRWLMGRLFVMVRSLWRDLPFLCNSCVQNLCSSSKLCTRASIHICNTWNILLWHCLISEYFHPHAKHGEYLGSKSGRGGNESRVSILMDSNPHDEETASPVNPRAGRSRTSVPSLLFISSFIILYLLTSHNGDEFLARHHYQDALQSLTFHLSNYSAWMNGTASNFSMVCRFPYLATGSSKSCWFVAEKRSCYFPTTERIPHPGKRTRSKRGIILP